MKTFEHSQPGKFEAMRKKFSAYTHAQSLQSGLGVFLENVFTHSMLRKREAGVEGVDTLGVLGITKAEGRGYRFHWPLIARVSANLSIFQELHPAYSGAFNEFNWSARPVPFTVPLSI